MIATMSLRLYILLAVLVGLGASLIVYSASSARNQDTPGTVPASPPAPPANTALEEPAVDAPQESDVRMVKTYEGYAPRDFKLKYRPRGDVHAHDLITLITDGTKNVELRRRANEVLLQWALFRGDLDLSKRLLREGRSTRAKFCELYLVGALMSSDRQTRTLAYDLLSRLWGGPGGGRGLGFDPDDSMTWNPTCRKWRKFLRTR